jgi:transposase
MPRRRLRLHIPVPRTPLPVRFERPVAWRPLSDEEWALARPWVAALHGRGRPVRDLRARLDACLHGACMRGAWHALPASFGRADTIHRQFRRWGEAGLWEALLHAVAQQGREPALRGLAYFVCRASRRAHRILGLAGLRLARALGMDSALRAPRCWLPDPDLSERFIERELLPGLETFARWPNALQAVATARWKQMLARCSGRSRIHRWMAPA